MTFLRRCANLFKDKEKSNDEESSLPEVLQRIPTECFNSLRRMQDGIPVFCLKRLQAERDEWTADEHGFRAAHRTAAAVRLRWVRPLQRRGADRHLLRSFSARIR